MAGKKAESKKFVVRFEVEGTMVDKDTPISEQALSDLIEMQFSGSKGFKVVRVQVEEA